LREARIAEEKGETERALELLRAAQRDHPDRVVTLFSLLAFHSRHPLPADDELELRRGLARLLADPEQSVPTGTLRFLVNDPDAGDEELELVLRSVEERIFDGEVEPRLLEAIVRLQLRLNRLESARESLTRLMGLDPNEDLRWLALALDRHLERWDDALAILEPWVRGDAPAPYARMVYIGILGRLGRAEEVREQVERLAAELPQSTKFREVLHSLLKEVAWELRDAGEDDEAEKVFRRVLSENPEDDEARAAVRHLYAGDEERAAMEEADRTGSGQDADPDKLLERGSAMLAAGDFAGSFELLQQAATALPSSEIAWLNLGLAASRLERWEIAESASARAAELNPSRANAFLNRGIALHKLGRCEEAIGVLEEVIRLRPDLGHAHYYLWACHKELGNADAAVRHLELYNGFQER